MFMIKLVFIKSGIISSGRTIKSNYSHARQLVPIKALVMFQMNTGGGDGWGVLLQPCGDWAHIVLPQLRESPGALLTKLLRKGPVV